MQTITVNSLIGKKVCYWQSEKPLGRVIDVSIQPMTGKVLGLIWETKTNAKLKILIEDLELIRDEIKIFKLDLNKSLWRQRCYSDGTKARHEILGRTVINENNQAIGKIEEIVIDGNLKNFQYQITKFKSFKNYKNKFYVPGFALTRAIGNTNQLVISRRHKNLFQTNDQTNLTDNSSKNWLSLIFHKKFELHPLVIWLSMICLTIGIISYT